MQITYQSIGMIHSPFTDPSGMPIQPAAAQAAAGEVEIYAAFSEGLCDIEAFSHLILLYHFHRSAPAKLTVKPFLDDRPHGVFATRAPARPNPIGLSVVRLQHRRGHLLHVTGIDVLDGTPLLDLKPYVPQFDAHDAERIGWLTGKVDGLGEVRADDRFSRGRP